MNVFLGNLLKALAGLLDARFLALALPSFVYLYTQPAIAGTIVYSIAAMICFAAVSHLLRKIFFPYADLEILLDSASRDPRGSAIIFFSITLVLCTVLYCTVLWLKG